MEREWKDPRGSGVAGRLSKLDIGSVHTLLILRHAKSGHDDGLPARPHATDAAEGGSEMGAVAREARLFRRVLCSTAERAREKGPISGRPWASRRGRVIWTSSTCRARSVPAASPACATRARDGRGAHPASRARTDLTGERRELPTQRSWRASSNSTAGPVSPATSGKLIGFFRPKDSD